MILAFALLACGAFQNTAPILVSVNGVLLDRSGYLPPDPALTYTPGETLPLRLEVDEPDRDRFRVWWPYAPGGLDFLPDDTEGTWAVHPEQPDVTGLIVLIVDDHPQTPRSAAWTLTLYAEGYEPGGDTAAPPR